MSLITQEQFTEFTDAYPEMAQCYHLDSDTADKEWLYDNFFLPGDVMDDLYDEDAWMKDMSDEDIAYLNTLDEEGYPIANA